MHSDKQGIRDLVEVCAQKGLRYIVISPGSRNAPLTISFSEHPQIKCISIADERSAAFFALGMAQQLGEPVAITCTSGTAALNYAPAIAEAYYQHIPLLVLTADRPNEWTDQADGQTIRQRNIFSNYIRASFELPQTPKTTDELWHNSRLVSEAINACMGPTKGPAHINIPLTESLYGQSAYNEPLPKSIHLHSTAKTLPDDTISALAKTWNSASKKLVIVGLMAPNEALNDILGTIADDDSVAVISETTSNLNNDAFNACIDRVILTVVPSEEEAFAPDLLVTLGGPVISKKIKSFLRTHKPKAHWHIDATDTNVDTYQSLTDGIQLAPENFLSQLQPHIEKCESDYKATWKTRDNRSEGLHQSYIATAPFCDLKAIDILLQHMPKGGQVQLGNSTPVRYAQLFKHAQDHVHYANRGTSGIDGSTSTAAGAAYVNNTMTTLITGDMSFFYDSNALWNQHLTGNLRIVLINNGGGGIFRIIDGPSSTDHLEEFFETKHEYRAEYIAKAFNVPYYQCDSAESLEQTLTRFYEPHDDRPVILEIVTPGEENALVLRNYFKHLRG
jgi:2-succinyl-5-enolpyruvyl-6-hydroxy-3-cyclohexene-1-carboxylate synthase